jgi:hypothetical protein
VRVKIPITDKMNRIRCFFFLTSFALLLQLAPSARAQGTYTAASSAESDVNAIINGPTHVAVNGDVIQIPCIGAQSVVWSNQLSISASIRVTALGGTPNTGTGTFGAGTNCLTILDNYTGGGPLFTFTLTYAATNNLATLENINIDPFTAGTSLVSPISFAGTCTASGCPNIRVNNIYFGKTIRWTSVGNGSNSTWLIRSDNVFGVIDHNTVPPGSDAVFDDNELSAYLGVGAFGDNSWAQPDSFGGANNLYMENNSIYVTRSLSDCEIAPAGGAIGGCRSVGRYNHITSSGGFGIFGLHGLDTDGRPRGGRQLEVYGNQITCILNGCNIIAGYRGGTGYTFGNTMIVAGTGFFNTFINISVYRTVFSAGGGWGSCGGSSPYDTNDGVQYYTGTTSTSGQTLTDTGKSWTTNQFIPIGAPFSVHDITGGWWAEIASNTSNTLTIMGSIPEQPNNFNAGDTYEILRATACADQGGRGSGKYVSGASALPASALSQVLNPIYEWDDSENPVRLNANVGTNTGRIIANRDWYSDNSNGAPHAQTSATSPFNGTTTCNAGSGSYTCGVGFGTMANRPTTCTPAVGYFATDVGAQGTLFKCLAANTWTASYTPYTYPHPLTTSNLSSNPPQPSTGLNALVQ